MFKSRAAKIIFFLVLPVLLAGLSFVYNYAGPLFSPGDVTVGHREFADSCFKCHAVFSPMSDSCLSCHKKISETISSQTGFHGNMDEKTRKNCIRCHTDHQGSAYFIISDVRQKSELDSTLEKIWIKNHPGEGKVTTIPGVKNDYYFLPDAANEKNRVAGKGFNWADQQKAINQKFDHSLTGYPLLGSHAGVTCEKCHKSLTEFQVSEKNGMFPSFFLKETSRETMCFSCHEKDDAGQKGHKGKYGRDCSQCHLVTGNITGWKALVPAVKNFHKDPKHKLNGAHARPGCRQCHESAPFRKKADDKTCIACHIKDDEGKNGHKGKYGKKCEECHVDGGGPGKWKDLIEKVRDFHKDPRHLLKGKHETLACVKCHLETPFNKKDEEKTCYHCHKTDDEKIHRESLGRSCENCHNESSFEKSTFDHQKTKFSLRGAHLKTGCVKCHPQWTPGKGKVKVYNKILKSDCFTCHARDDIHHGTFKNDCARCHRETYWLDIIGN